MRPDLLTIVGVKRSSIALFHLLLTLMTSVAITLVILCLLFPHAFAGMVGAYQLIFLVVGCNLILGLLASFVVYKPRKPNKEAVRDYLFIVMVQCVVLAYGLSVVFDSRPVLVVFAVDRLEVVRALDINTADLSTAKQKRYKSLSWFGPRLVSIEMPTDPSERNEILFQGLVGKDVHLMPRYYVPYEDAHDQILRRSYPASELSRRHREAEVLLEAAANELGKTKKELIWLPVKHPFGFWTALIDPKSGYPIKYLPIDPY